MGGGGLGTVYSSPSHPMFSMSIVLRQRPFYDYLLPAASRETLHAYPKKYLERLYT